MTSIALPVAEVTDLMDSGRVLDAWKTASDTGVPLHKWEPGEALHTAANLAAALGSARMRQVLHWLNWRHDRTNPKLYFHALYPRLRYTPGVYLISEVESFRSNMAGPVPEHRANLLAFLGWIHATHRDFHPAYKCIGEALDLNPGDPWIHVQHSRILETADRYEEALQAALSAVRIDSINPGAVIQCADCLVHLGRDQEAVDLLLNADEKTQSAAFAMRLQVHFSEAEDHRRALWCLDRIEARSPLMEESLRGWIAGRRADFHFMAGDIENCLKWCDEKDEGFHKRMADALRRPGAASMKRVRLDVPFVRQHRMTCAPATLSAIAAYWRKPHDHLAIADAICHEGTPWHKERQWAREHGFVTREFRVTAEALHELANRNVPFTLATEAVTSAHLQACIGYDDRTGVVLLRDPTERHFNEVFLSSLIRNHPISGPRGMVLIPPEEDYRLEGIYFPDEAAYDAYHDLLVAMDGHDRWQVDTALHTLRAVAPDHPLGLRGTEQAAVWKGDRMGQLQAIDEQLRRFPDNQSVMLRKAGALRGLGRREELREFLEERISREDTDAVFSSELGELLMEDARLLPRAEHQLNRAIRKRRGESRCYEGLGRLRAKQLRREESMVLRRVASCLAPDFEPYAKGFFDECRAAGRTKEGIAFLTERAEEIGSKASDPWITLAAAVNQVRNAWEAVEILNRAVAARPGDGNLRLAAGSMMTGWGGDFRITGLEWMEMAKGHVSEVSWHLETAKTAAFLGDRGKAVRGWRSVLRFQPLNIGAWRGLARMVAENEGEDAAIALLDQATSQNPRAVELWCLKAEWLVGTKRGPIPALNEALGLDASNVWALRERALRLMESDRGDEAEKDAHEAAALDPWSAESHGILGFILSKRSKRPEAVCCFKEAIRLSVDYSFAAESLMNLGVERHEELGFIHFIEKEMRRQVSDGTIVPVYQRIAWAHIEPSALLAKLKAFCHERPDLWQTWSATIEQSLRMGLDSEALDAGTALTESFPLMPRAWLELARVHQSAGRHEKERDATQRASDLSPGWDEAARAHANVLEVLGCAGEAAKVLERACLLDPLNGPNHGCLADHLRRNGRKADALAMLRRALETCPHYSWGWRTVAKWGLEDGMREEIAADLRLAGDLHGHCHYWWPTAASAWEELGEHSEAIAAVRKGLAFNPSNPDLRDQLAFLLWTQNRHEEALEACGALKGEENPPISLQGRRAWLLMHTGQPLKGMAEMRELVRREPTFAWGMGELANWHEQREEWESLRDLCLQWLRVSPREVRVLGYLGKAELALKNAPSAKEAFARAHALDPEYLFAGRQLLDLQMRDKELDAAAVTLARLEHYSTSPYLSCDGIELDLMRGNPASAFSRAGNLLGNPAATDGVFIAVAKLFSDHGGGAEWRKWLKNALEAGPVTAPGALVAFLSTVPKYKLLKTTTAWLGANHPNDNVRVAAWLHTIRELKEDRNRFGKSLRKLSRNHSSHLFLNGQTWNALGEALLTVGAAKECVRWLGNWRDRVDDVNSATLVNLSAALDTLPGRENSRWAEAGKLRAEAYRRFPDSQNSQAIRAGHALHLAADGLTDEAGEVLADFEDGLTSDYYRALANCARAIVCAAEGNENEARTRLSKAFDHLGRFSDLGSVRLRERTERVVASRLHGTRSSVRKLRKRWNLPISAKATVHSASGSASGFPIWPFAIAAIMLLRACSTFAQP